MFVKRNKVTIIAIFKHRVKKEKVGSIINKIMPGLLWCTNATNEVRGKNWIVWKIVWSNSQGWNHQFNMYIAW